MNITKTKILIGKAADLVHPAILIAFTVPKIILSIVNIIAGYGKAAKGIQDAIKVVENAEKAALNWYNTSGQKIVTEIKKI